MTRWPRRTVLLAGPLAVTALLAGCDGVGQVDPAVAGDGDAAIPSSGPGLFTVNSQRLGGPIVIDGQGYAVYRSDADAADPSRSACTGGCTTTWPPLAAGDLGRLRVVGMDRGRVGRVARPDGTGQLTLFGWPLYSFTGDRMPGDTSGHGTDGHFVISPRGTRAGRAGT